MTLTDIGMLFTCGIFDSFDDESCKLKGDPLMVLDIPSPVSIQ